MLFQESGKVLSNVDAPLPHLIRVGGRPRSLQIKHIAQEIIHAPQRRPSYRQWQERLSRPSPVAVEAPAQKLFRHPIRACWPTHGPSASRLRTAGQRPRSFLKTGRMPHCGRLVRTPSAAAARRVYSRRVLCSRSPAVAGRVLTAALSRRPNWLIWDEPKASACASDDCCAGAGVTENPCAGALRLTKS